MMSVSDASIEARPLHPRRDDFCEIWRLNAVGPMSGCLPEKRPKDQRTVCLIRTACTAEDKIGVQHGLSLSSIVHQQHRSHEVAHPDAHDPKIDADNERYQYQPAELRADRSHSAIRQKRVQRGTINIVNRSRGENNGCDKPDNCPDGQEYDGDFETHPGFIIPHAPVQPRTIKLQLRPYRLLKVEEIIASSFDRRLGIFGPRRDVGYRGDQCIESRPLTLSFFSELSCGVSKNTFSAGHFLAEPFVQTPVSANDLPGTVKRLACDQFSFARTLHGIDVEALFVAEKLNTECSDNRGASLSVSHVSEIGLANSSYEVIEFLGHEHGKCCLDNSRTCWLRMHCGGLSRYNCPYPTHHCLESVAANEAEWFATCSGDADLLQLLLKAIVGIVLVALHFLSTVSRVLAAEYDTAVCQEPHEPFDKVFHVCWPPGLHVFRQFIVASAPGVYG